MWNYLLCELLLLNHLKVCSWEGYIPVKSFPHLPFIPSEDFAERIVGNERNAWQIVDSGVASAGWRVSLVSITYFSGHKLQDWNPVIWLVLQPSLKADFWTLWHNDLFNWIVKKWTDSEMVCEGICQPGLLSTGSSFRSDYFPFILS